MAIANKSALNPLTNELHISRFSVKEMWSHFETFLLSLEANNTFCVTGKIQNQVQEVTISAIITFCIHTFTDPYDSEDEK
jgi:hypothetical protein